MSLVLIAGRIDIDIIQIVESSSGIEWRGGVLAVLLADKLLPLYWQYVRVVSFVPPSANYHNRLASIHGSSACASAHYYYMEPPTALAQEIGTLGPDGYGYICLYLCCDQNVEVA